MHSISSHNPPNVSHSQPHGLGTALFIDFKAAAPTTGLPPPSLAAPRSCLVLSNLNCEPSVTDTASWKGREAVLFIIRRSWPSEHGHFFQAACQSPHSPGSIYGPPTGPCGHRIASKGTEAAWSSGLTLSQEGEAQSAPPGPARGATDGPGSLASPCFPHEGWSGTGEKAIRIPKVPA